MSAQRNPILEPPTLAQHDGVDATITALASLGDGLTAKHKGILRCRSFHIHSRCRPLPNPERLISYLTGTIDFVTLLTTTKKSQILTKRVSLDPNSAPILRDYDQAKHFRFDKVAVCGLYDVARVIDNVGRNSALILGEPTDAAVPGARRLAYDHPESGERATLTTAAHLWLPIDLDSVPCPEELDPIAAPEAAAEYVVRNYLPAEMQDRDLYWQLTSSAGFKPGIRLRLFFWLDCPLQCEEMKQWLGGFDYVDASIYSPNQLIYAAKPIFAENVPDPVPRRSGIVAGTYRTVSPPDLTPPTTAGGESPKYIIDNGPKGYAFWCKRIGDHQEGEGFHEPIKKAIGAYIGANGSGNTELLRAQMERAIRAAQRDTSMHPDSYIEKQIRDLPRLIKWTQEQETRPREEHPEVQSSSPTDAAIRIAEHIAVLNKHFAVVLVGNRVMILREHEDEEGRPSFTLIGVEAFKLWLANDFIELPDKTGDLKKMKAAPLWLNSPNRREYNGIVFKPGRTTPGYYNLWRGFAIAPGQDGSCELFKAHLKDNVCQGNEELFRWVFGWFAHIFQHPADKCGTALVLRGKQGVGKTIVGKTIGHLIGGHYLKVASPRFVTGRFNAHLESVLLLHCDEAFWAGDHAAAGLLKDLVTGEDHLIEHKGLEAIRVDNYVRLLVTGNEDWIIPAGLEERRFAVLDVGETHMQDAPYFKKIIAELEAGGYERLMHELRAFDLSQIDLCTIPKTEALLDQKIEAFKPEQAYWYDILMNGQLPHGDRLPNEVVCKTLFADYVKHAQLAGIKRRSDETKFGMFLSRIVPSLTKSRVRLTGGGGLAWVYIFPPLAECRAAFERELGQPIKWTGPAEWAIKDGFDASSLLREVHPPIAGFYPEET
jgi:hypothetical protein